MGSDLKFVQSHVLCINGACLVEGIEQLTAPYGALSHPMIGISDMCANVSICSSFVLSYDC